MGILSKFKPNLIPNNPKDSTFDLDKIIMKNGGYSKYQINKKKDGCRLQLIDGLVLSRALKVPGSRLVVERFQEVALKLKELNIAVDGEFYMHGLKFNSIFRFFSKSDVTCPKYKLQLEKELYKNEEKFLNEYEGKGIDFLTTFHDNLKFHIFDGIILDRPDLVKYSDRMKEIRLRMLEEKIFYDCVKFSLSTSVNSKEELEQLYELALSESYEGLVLTHIDHEYKFGRNSLAQGTLLKMKDDSQEFDGIILNVMEGTSVKEGVERTTDNLGYSETSKKKDDRELSGLAKGFLVQFENKGTFIVGLNGFDNEQKRELLENKESYIGRHFKYTAMEPVRDFPRHAFFDCWRDSK